jgi:hypothetical protein
VSGEESYQEKAAAAGWVDAKRMAAAKKSADVPLTSDFIPFLL